MRVVKRRIKSICIIHSSVISMVEVGVKNVHEIMDSSGGLHKQFDILNNKGDVLRSIINLPVDIEYFPEEP